MTTKKNETVDLNAVLARLDALEKENQVLKIQATSVKVKKEREPMAKITDKGGLWFSGPSMKGFSESKQKEYQVGINIHAYQLEAFASFLQDEKLMSIVKATLGIEKAS